MKRMINGLLRLRAFSVFIIPNILFLAVVFPTDGKLLINALNAVLISLATGVCVAYLKPTLDVLFRHSERQIETAEVLILGIYCAWSALLISSVYSIAWRWVGQPFVWTNSSVVSYSKYMACWGAVFHLAAPHVIGNHVPPRRWVNIGILVALAVLIGIGISYFAGAPSELFWMD